jgi:glycosyltransferase involved in cell wall biosynthesis
MQILHVTPTYLPAVRYGGPIYSVHGLCKALAARGHDVHVFTTNVDGPGISDAPLDRPTVREGVPVHYFPTALGRRLYRSPAMKVALASSVPRFDLVHLHSAFLWPANAAARIARAAAVPYIFCPHGMLVDALIRRKARLFKRTWIELFERTNIAGAAAVQMTAQIEADEFRKLDLVARRVEIIPNGLELAPGDLQPAAEPVAPRRAVFKWRIISLGRLNWKKGLERLIEAMAHIPDAELVLAGNDEEDYRIKLERLAKGCGVAERVTFTGAVYGEPKWGLIRSADLFVMPSYSENFGLAALEAMACGVPVVVTPEVGLARDIAGSGAGLVVPGEPKTLAAALNELLAAPGRREQMSAAGRVAAGRYSWTTIAGQMEVLYGVICEERAAPRSLTDIAGPAP